MNTNIMLLLMAVCIAIQQIEIQTLSNRIYILEHNNEVLRKGINDLNRR